MSRRDNLLSSLEGARSIIAESFASQSNANDPQSTAGTSPRTRISRGLSGVTRGLNALLNENPSMSSPQASSSQNVYSMEQAPNHAPVLSAPLEPGEVNGDDLPDYSRRDPRLVTPYKEFSYSNKSGKLEATVQGAGRDAQFPIFVKDGFDVIRGAVHVKLEKPEPIISLKIRLKCCVHTSILVARGSTRQPITDEVLLFDEGIMLWEAPPDQDIPKSCKSLIHSSGPIPLPPSFVLGGRPDVLEVASVRYYLKITLARQGLLRPNDRLFIPVAYMKQNEPTIQTRDRALAHLAERPIPPPSVDPNGWAGKSIKQECGKGMVFGRKQVGAYYEATALIPYPAVFDRHAPLPFHLKLTSTHPQHTSKFPTGSITTVLVQYATVKAQGASAIFENVVTAASLEVLNGETGQDELDAAAEAVVWTKRFRGSMSLPVLPPSFSGPNIKVDYALVINIRSPKAPSAQLMIPLRIISTPSPNAPSAFTLQPTNPHPPQASSSTSTQQPQSSQSYEPPGSDPPATEGTNTAVPQAEAVQEPQPIAYEDLDLPPSYWQAVNDDGHAEQSGNRRLSTTV